jgi:hypothetical protein
MHKHEHEHKTMRNALGTNLGLSRLERMNILDQSRSNGVGDLDISLS